MQKLRTPAAGTKAGKHAVYARGDRLKNDAAGQRQRILKANGAGEIVRQIANLVRGQAVFVKISIAGRRIPIRLRQKVDGSAVGGPACSFERGG